MPENQDVLPKWDSRQIHNIDCEEIALKTYLELIVKWLDIFGNLESHYLHFLIESARYESDSSLSQEGDVNS